MNNNEKMITVCSANGKLHCSFADECKKDMKQIWNIDIEDEIKKLLNKEEQAGYEPGEYVFSFANKHLSVHHVDLKSEIKNNLNRILKMYMYGHHNDQDTRMCIKADLMNYLNMLRDKHALNDYNIICDETNNTQDIIDKNSLQLRLGLKMTKDADITIIDAIITMEKAQ